MYDSPCLEIIWKYVTNLIYRYQLFVIRWYYIWQAITFDIFTFDIHRFYIIVMFYSSNRVRRLKVIYSSCSIVYQEIKISLTRIWVMRNPKLAAPFGRSISHVPLYAPKLSHIPNRSSVSSSDLIHPHLAHLLYWFKLRHPHVPHSFATSCLTIFLWHFLLNPSGNLCVAKTVIPFGKIYWKKW